MPCYGHIKNRKWEPLPGEMWLSVPGFSDYFASSCGRIRKNGALITQTKRRSSGYLVCQISGQQHRVNRIVCLAFHGEPPSPLHQAAHLDGNRANNCADNLAWKTPQENSDDLVQHGTKMEATKHWKAKLSDDDIRQIRQRRKAGETVKSIQASFPHVCQATVSHIVTGRTWTSVV